MHGSRQVSFCSAQSGEPLYPTFMPVQAWSSMNTEIRRDYGPFGDVKGFAVFSGFFRQPATQSDLLHPLDVFGGVPED
jgi:hypothetical protein